jgi:hypothetical protein
MAASRVYSWDYIAPNTTVSVFCHGGRPDYAYVFSAAVGPQSRTATVDLFYGVAVTQNEAYYVMDGQARTVYVKNLALPGGNGVSVGLDVIYEPVGG